MHKLNNLTEERKVTMRTENNSPWGYLVRINETAPIIELHGRLVPVFVNDELAFQMDRNEKGEMVLLITSFPCWVYKTKVTGNEIKIKYGAWINVEIGKKRREFKFEEKSKNEKFIKDAKLNEKYIVGKKLGQGSFGQVFILYEKLSGHRKALKVQQWSVGNSYLAREAEILPQLKHPCIIHTHDIKYSTTHMYFVMEYMNGGDLSRFVNQGSHLSEQETKIIFYQIVKAIYHLHSKGISHRDLKPANILLRHPQPNTLIKVSDLGLAKSEILHSPLNTWCGTVAFMAPEVLRGGREIYDKNIDVWSMGVILHLSLSGTFPTFSGDILKFTGDVSQWINSPVINLLQGMLCKHPLRRFDISMVDQHQWMKDKIAEEKVLRLMKHGGKKKMEKKATLGPVSPLKEKKKIRKRKKKRITDDLKTVKSGQNIDSIYEKTLIATNDSNNQNTTLKAEVPKATLSVTINSSAAPTRPCVEKKLVGKQQCSNVYHNNKSINDGTVSTYETKKQIMKNIEHIESTLNTMKGRAVISKPQGTINTPVTPTRLTFETTPIEKQQWSSAHHNYKRINDRGVFNDSLKNFAYSTNYIHQQDNNSYNADSGYKKTLVSTYASNSQNQTLKIKDYKASSTPVASTRQYVERIPLENQQRSKVYHNHNKIINERRYYKDYTETSHIDNHFNSGYSYHYEYDHYNDHNNQIRKDDEGGFLSSALFYGFILGGIYLIWYNFSKCR